MERTRRAALALLLAATLAATAGCVAGAFVGGVATGAAAATSAYVYETGKLEATFGKPVPTVYQATLASLKDMNIAVSNTSQDAAGADIEAKRPDGTDVGIGLKSKGAESTETTIRVGLLGDEDVSRAIADNIAARLGEPECQVGRGGQPPPSQPPSQAPGAPSSPPEVQQEDLSQ